MRNNNFDADKTKDMKIFELENLKQDSSEYALLNEKILTDNNKIHNTTCKNHNIL